MILMSLYNCIKTAGMNNILVLNIDTIQPIAIVNGNITGNKIIKQPKYDNLLSIYFYPKIHGRINAAIIGPIINIKGIIKICISLSNISPHFPY
jgi:hypothetical protein